MPFRFPFFRYRPVQIPSLQPWRSHRSASSLSLPQIDAKWQKIWEEQGRRTPGERLHPGGRKSYVLPMFAYPSGSLHMGHLRVYTISDVIARYRRMRGFQVLHPTGWDAFGLPAENAAIERGIDPAEWTEQNIYKMKQQLKSMNTSFNWDAEISTCSPHFYKHTQKLFLMLYQKGLAYQADALVNWDPVDRTVLANEQVDSNGRSWRSGAIVEQIKLKQWFFRITKYKEQLLSGLEFLASESRWPERVLSQQKNWLGRSEGAKVKFGVTYLDPGLQVSASTTTSQTPMANHPDSSVTVFTTRPDTIYGVKYLALALTHPLVRRFAKTNSGLRAFLDEAASLDSESKAGFLLPLAARSPVQPMAKLPVYVAPYVLDSYGEGAVMGVPAHDHRDLAFWKHHRPEEKVPVVVRQADELPGNLFVAPSDLQEAQTSLGILTEVCERYSGLTSELAITELYRDFGPKSPTEIPDTYIEPAATWKLRDWLVSRQRYWGTPIPIVHCRKCGSVPVPEEELPIELPRLGSARNQKGNPLDRVDEWINCECPQCRGPAKRETDTMDTFVDSSWYHTRFPDPNHKAGLVSKERAASMLPVDTYVGGVEHAILHLLYARFIYKFLADEGIVPTNLKSGDWHPKSLEKGDYVPSHQEPFLQLIAQGMVHGRTFSDPETGRFLLPHEVYQLNNEVIIRESGVKPIVTWEKMSKSKHNGVDPSTCISKYGADTTRAHILFAAPVSEILQWDEEKIVGIQRWFGRVQKLVNGLGRLEEPPTNGGIGMEEASDLVSPVEANLLLLTNTTVQNVTQTFDKDTYRLNTTVSDLIKLTNALFNARKSQVRPVYFQMMVTTLLRMMAPIAPAFAEQCWEDIGLNQSKRNSILDSGMWPQEFLTQTAERVLQKELTEMSCAIQINGNFRFTAMVPKPGGDDGAKVAQEDVDKILNAILATEEGKLWLTERRKWDERRRVIVVKGGRLVNIVF